MAEYVRSQTAGPQLVGRIVIYSLLILVALYYLMPLFVMLITSLKSLDDIRSGNLLSLPRAVTLEPWFKAWGEACTGVFCGGLKGNFMNSVMFVLPAVIISTLIGAMNGYVLTIFGRKCHYPDISASNRSTVGPSTKAWLSSTASRAIGIRSGRR